MNIVWHKKSGVVYKHRYAALIVVLDYFVGFSLFVFLMKLLPCLSH